MRIAGIIAEYNPFHNGHLYHVRQTRRISGCDYVVAVMDGGFTQRGEAAVLSKWTRVRMALACGVDAVFELPALFAVRTADVFARAGVAILGGLGADVLSFGSETDDLALLTALAQLRAREPEALSRDVQRRLSEGMAHPRAWGEAAAAHLGVAPEALDRPNTILAAEYLRAAMEQGWALQPCPVRRIGEYRDVALGELASASAIRQALRAGDSRAADAVPAAVRDCLREARGAHDLDDVLLMRLREMSREELAALEGASEGIEGRLYRACREASGREELLERMRCRRYTQARISRLLAHALLGITRDLAREHPLPGYARLLGARREAAPLLKELKRRSALPMLSDPAQLAGDAVFDLECRASDLWALGRNAPGERRAGREFTEKFIAVDSEGS